MNKEFIPYEQALELKELGFDEGCIALYRENRKDEMVIDIREQNGLHWSIVKNIDIKSSVVACVAPLYQQAFRWFRDKQIISSIVSSSFYDYSFEIYSPTIIRIHSDYCKTYEEAELACLKKLIEIVKNKQN